MSIAEGKFELDLMRGYEESFRNRMSRVVSLSYDCMPLNPDQYAQKVMVVLESMKAINPNDKDLTLYDEIILGKIQGQAAGTNFKQVIESIVGEISEEKLKAYLKQKSQQRSFGASNKDKNCCIRQVKKLQSLHKYFDVQEITKKRKHNKLFSASIKSLAKYLELYSKILQSDLTTIEKAFQQYNHYNKEQKKFAQFLKEQEQAKNIVDKPPTLEEIKPQAQLQAVDIIEEEHHQITEIQQIREKNQQQKKPSQPQVKTAKKSKSKKKEQKPEDPAIQEVNSADTTEKEKRQADERQKKNQERQKQVKEKQKTVKKPNNKLLTEFFGFKKEKNVQALKKPIFEQAYKVASVQQAQQQNPAVQIKQTPAKTQSIWERLGQAVPQDSQSNLAQLASLRQQFRAYRMQNQQYNPEAHFTNIIMTLSTIQYYDYMMQVDREVDFRDPFKKISKVLYFEDESQQFEGESADLDAEEDDQEEEDELSSGNHTILSDDHLSNQELSSCEVNDLHLKIEYGKGRKWVINFVSRSNSMHLEDEIQICKTFSMISLQTDQQKPLRVDEEQETVQFVMTSEIWRDIYKLAHGYYATKDSIIKDLSALLPGLSKNWIDSMLRQRSEKIANQRFIKKDFIDDLKEKVPEIDSLLEKVLDDRNEELRKIRAEKNQQKDLKLQKDILQCTGSRYIVNLIKQLKEKGYKQMRRNQLAEFINERKGEEWEKIKVQMNTMSRPIDELIRNMPVSDKIDVEVQVDDEEYKKIQSEAKNDANSNSSIKDKNNGANAGSINKKAANIKGKSGQQRKELKSTKMKRRRNKEKNAMNIYQKTKQINRGRRTKNSLKTGIPTIQELKKQKQQKKSNQEKEGENFENEQSHNSEKESSQEEQIKAEDEENNEPQVIINWQQQKSNDNEIALNLNQLKKSIEKSVFTKEVSEDRVWISKESQVKEEGTAQKSEQSYNLTAVINIEQQ